jgi:hypothetical protein
MKISFESLCNLKMLRPLPITARRFNELPTAARADMSFCIIQVDEHDLFGPDKVSVDGLKVSLSRQNCQMDESRLTAESLGHGKAARWNNPSRWLRVLGHGKAARWDNPDRWTNPG